jgi:crotonobetaine/carnitine-CoA ligase
MTAELRRLLAASGIVERFDAMASSTPERVVVREGEVSYTFAELAAKRSVVEQALQRFGVTTASRVAVALTNSVDHVATIFAVWSIGATWVPVNPRLFGTALAHQLGDSHATHAVAEGDSALERLASQDADLGEARQWAQLSADLPQLRIGSWPDRDLAALDALPGVAAIMYTSGTTGPPKGVLVTESMLMAAAFGCLEVTRADDGDVMFLWEPLFHIGGAQVLVLPLLRRVELALVPTFSASSFWREVSTSGATHIHYLGGVLQILLRQPIEPWETKHNVRVAWGAGATPAVWRAFSERFNVAIHECYGSTETSSIVTVNHEGPEHGIGKELPWFRVQVDHLESHTDGVGEITVFSLVDGTISPGYLNHAEAGHLAHPARTFRTGDLARRTTSGDLVFIGRDSDSIRVRGENVSAWLVEQVFDEHPQIARCAAVGVPANIGEQDILLYVQVLEGTDLEELRLLQWGASRLPRYALPRYAASRAHFPLTSSNRVEKHRLPRDLTEPGVLDLHAPPAVRPPGAQRTEGTSG